MSSNEGSKCCAHKQDDATHAGLRQQTSPVTKLRHSSCLCGAVKLDFSDVIIKSFLCHCTDDRKISGSLFAHSVLVPDTDTTSSTSLKTYAKKADSGNTMTNYFCSECGSTMYRTSSGFPGILVVTGGTIDGELPAPDVEQWTGSKLSWLGETVEGEKCVGGWKPNH